MFTNFRHSIAGKKFAVVAAFFGISCLLLMAALLLQGPRIRRVELDNKKLVTQLGQRIVLRANQPLMQADASAVSIEPKAKFSVMTAGDAIVLQMQDQLTYNTTYTVTVKGLKGQQSSKLSDYSYRFKTADATLYYVRRNLGFDLYGYKQPDKILQRHLHSTKEEVVFEAERIKEFVLLDDALIVSTTSKSGRIDTLRRVNLEDNTSTVVTMPKGTVSELHASPNGRDFGYIFTPAGKHRPELHIFDSRANLTFTIDGIDSKPVAPAYWQYAPDGKAAAVQIPGTGTYLIDTTGKNKPVPLGNFYGLLGFSRDGSSLLVRTAENLVIVDTLARKQQIVEPVMLDGDFAYPYTGLLLPNASKNTTIQHAFTYAMDISRSHVYVQSGSTIRELYTKNTDDENVLDLGVSPNGQYAAIEIGSKDASDEQYPGDTQPKGAYTEIINTSNGNSAGGVDGFGIVWD
jgi:hypothetical protein